MNPDDDLKPIPQDPAQIERMLEIELMQKRAQWQQSKARHGTLRILSFAFLFLVILIGILVFFWALSSDRMHEMKTRPGEEADPSPLATPESSTRENNISVAWKAARAI
ncbi:MAG: hypothetical protein ABI946_05620 [Chthoniobacterales bacterium]